MPRWSGGWQDPNGWDAHRVRIRFVADWELPRQSPHPPHRWMDKSSRARGSHHNILRRLVAIRPLGTALRSPGPPKRCERDAADRLCTLSTCAGPSPAAGRSHAAGSARSPARRAVGRAAQVRQSRDPRPPCLDHAFEPDRLAKELMHERRSRFGIQTIRHIHLLDPSRRASPQHGRPFPSPRPGRA